MDWYAQSTLVHPLTTIRRERLLPAAGEVVARIGQDMQPAQVVARMPRQTDFHIIPVSDLLRIPPEDLPELLLVNEGDSVERGAPLLKRRGLFSMKFVSPVDGVLHRVSNGRLVIQLTAGWLELRALMKARVANQIPGRGVVLETHGTLIQGVWGSGKDNIGSLRLATSSPNMALDEYDIEGEERGQILVAGKLDRPAAVQKAIASSAGGLIVGSITANLMATAVSAPFPVLITDGIGHQNMLAPIFELLKEMAGNETTLFANPRRVGDRPEIIIPQPRIPKKDAPPPNRPLAAGQRVRIARGQHSGQMGTLSQLHNRPITTSIGTRTLGAEVTLANGSVIFVPYVNLDVII